MYRITKMFELSSAHYLRNYEGPCKRLHGHNYKVEVSLESKYLDERGMIMDFGTLKKLSNEAFFEKYDHHNLNETGDYNTVNPTAEAMAKTIYYRVRAGLWKEKVADHIDVVKVRVWETSTAWAEYYQE